MNQSSTPLWLDLKTNYIDDNFDKLVDYLRNTADKNDRLYKETLKLLEKRIEELIESESNKRLYDSPTDKELTIFNIKLLVVYLLARFVRIEASTLRKVSRVAGMVMGVFGTVLLIRGMVLLIGS